jgi:4-amino-4-deoxy-L-arabinose transferase-like glycosyltransferase
MRGTRVALAVGLALTALALVLVLSGSPDVAAPEAVPAHPVAIQPKLAVTQHGASICQRDETLPRATTAIRVLLKALIGPRIAVKVLAGGRIVTSGERGPGWTSGAVTVPVARVGRTVAHAKVCLAFALSDETVDMEGERASGARAAFAAGGQVLPGRMHVEYLRAGDRSWWSLALSTARHLGLGRAWAGTWVALLVLALVGIMLALTVWRVLAFGHGTVAVAVSACALVACVNAAAWSILTPPFQVPDETDHFAYVQQLAASGLPPSSRREEYSQSEQVALSDLRQFAVRLQPENHTIFARAAQRQLEANLVQAERLPQRAEIGAEVATGQPPLYYALQAIPYTLTGGTVLERLAVMRLLSALLAGITAMFVFLFIRETLPGVPWAWTVGALGVALAPLLGFMSGAVNPDGLLFALSAALFYCLARGFKHGLTPRLALTLGTVVGLGLATKLNFIGLTPGALLGLTVLARRASTRDSWRHAAGLLGLALAALAVPVGAAVIVNVLGHRPPLGQALDAHAAALGSHGTIPGEIAYIWQLYLPRLPFMHHDFSVFAPRQIWFDGYIGLYGWLDTTFPTWVYNLALIPEILIAGLCLRTLLTNRTTLRQRATELVVYATIAAGLLLLLGISSYSEFPEYGASYGEARYLLPLLPLLGALLALAARGAGRRWGPIIGTLIVTLAFAHDIFSQIQVVARYYN